MKKARKEKVHSITHDETFVSVGYDKENSKVLLHLKKATLGSTKEEALKYFDYLKELVVMEVLYNQKGPTEVDSVAEAPVENFKLEPVKKESRQLYENEVDKVVNFLANLEIHRIQLNNLKNNSGNTYVSEVCTNMIVVIDNCVKTLKDQLEEAKKVFGPQIANFAILKEQVRISQIPNPVNRTMKGDLL